MGNDFSGMPDLGRGLGIDAVTQQERGGRPQNFFRLFAVVGVHRFLAQHVAGTGRQLGLHVEQGELVVGAEQLFVRDQVSQHFLGVRASVDGQQDFHKTPLKWCKQVQPL